MWLPFLMSKMFQLLKNLQPLCRVKVCLKFMMFHNYIKNALATLTHSDSKSGYAPITVGEVCVLVLKRIANFTIRIVVTKMTDYLIIL